MTTSTVLDGALTLDSVSFAFELSFEAGEHLAVVGPNGAGKSTLLRTIAGLERLTVGTLSHRDTPIDAPASSSFVEPHRRPITLQPQDGALFPHLDVLDNVAFPLRRRGGRSRREARTTALELLDRVGASTLAHHRPATLSGGQAAKVAVARSLAAAPDVLLLDEPAAALDVEARAELRRLIAELDQTVLTVTHDPLEAQLLGTRLVVVDDGRIAQVGSHVEVSRAPTSPWIAGFSGVNVVSGHALDHEVRTSTGAVLRIAERFSGAVHVAFPANAVTLAAECPHGSARNVFEATISGLTTEGELVRVLFHAGFDAAAMVTASAAEELALRPGGTVWASIKATELTVLPA